ncbi:DNA ligase 1 [Caerostris extrusa]|uniref:DNA ligase n=1 Tax=Caerostris extrusa TaxID=172846 RepID=A0AAV4WGT5_CAEEX|nr:DNA ligase 1 [Caerostris extrusa]
MSQKSILSFFKQTESPTAKKKSVDLNANEKSQATTSKKINGNDKKSENEVNGDTKNSNSKKLESKSESKNESDSKRKISTIKEKKSPSNKEKIKISTIKEKKSPSSKEIKNSPSVSDSKNSVTNGYKKSDVNDNSENTTHECYDDSPVKQPKKRKRIQQLVDSDEDSQDVPRNDTEEMEVDESETPDDVDSETVSSKNTNKSSLKNEKKSNSRSSNSSEHSSKRRKTEQDNEDAESDKEAKSEDNTIQSENNADVIQPNSPSNECMSSTNQDIAIEYIPKRKTDERWTTEKTSNLTQVKDEIEKSTSPTVKTETPKAENNESENTNTATENSKSDLNNSKTESCDDDDESENQDVKETIPPKKAIHPFFVKEADNTSPGEKSNKKDIKCSSATGNEYDPSKTRYHPIDDACWKKGEKVPYLALAKTLEIIEETSARLKIVEVLSNFLRSVIVLTPEDLLYSVYLCLNRLAPEYEGIELGVGETLLMKAVAQATGRTVEKIKAEVVVKGDLGLVAESSRGNQRIMFAPPKLTVSSVFSKFKEIAKMSGNTAMSLSGKLRIGLAEQSVLAALARAAVLTPPNQDYPPEIMDKSSKMSADSFKEFLQEQILILKTTYCECPNFDVVIPVLLKEGIAGLPAHCQLQPGCPLKPMLAHPTNGIDEVLNRFDKNEFTCEFKYDGERAQIHLTEKGDVKIFSRNQEDNTSKYPDVISRLRKALKESTKSFILDTEAVAWDCETKQILPFQDAVESDIVVQVCIMAFDLLYLNGESLVKKTLKERRELLHSSFVEIDNEFTFVKYRDGDSAETMQEFLDESVKVLHLSMIVCNCEGLMVKALTVDASYEIAKRSHNWLKLKKDYLNGIGDTLDLVVIGGYHGKGKRKGGYGGFLLACYDDENEEFQSICREYYNVNLCITQLYYFFQRLGTGFSDKELETHTDFFKQHVISEPKSYYRYDNSLEPDVWFDAVQIWEIKCADLSISPVHKAAIELVSATRILMCVNKR